MYSRFVNIPKTKSFLLLGPRQTGKSTLLRAEFPEETTLTYNLLNQRTHLKLSNDPDILIQDIAQRKKTITHVVIDEIQKVPALLDVIHNILEAPNPPIFVMTGSSARKLKREHANLLAGRALERFLFPLTHLELGEAFNLDRALNRGTLPAIYLEPDEAIAADQLSSYVSVYLLEEIQYETKLRSIGPFSRFLIATAGIGGAQINYSSIARQTQTKDKTVREYFQILEDTLLGFFLLSYASSARKKLSTHPKFYFFDTGVMKAILGQEKAQTKPQTTAYGDLFEVWVINEVRRLLSYEQLRCQLSFFRVEKGPELDLIIEHSTRPTIAVEIKSSAVVSVNEVRKGFEQFHQVDSKSLKIVVYTGQQYREVEGIQFMPWKEFFQFLVKWAREYG